MTDTQERHPSALSADELAALQASDPAAFDKDDAGEPDDAGADAGAGDADADAGNGNGEGEGAGDAEAQAAAAAAAAAAAEAEAAGKQVPAARLAEVVGQRNAAEAMVVSQAAELAALRERLTTLQAQPPKDFEAAFVQAEQDYDSGAIDQSEWERRKRDLQREEFAHISKVSALQAQQESLEVAVERSWTDQVTAWRNENPGFLEAEGNADVFQRALNAVAAFHGPSIDNASLLAKASAMAFEATGYVSPKAKPAAAAEGADGAKPGDARRAQNAMRAASASATPPLMAGGVGGRGGPQRDVDLSHVKPGTFSKNLSRADQEAMLGDGAL